MLEFMAMAFGFGIGFLGAAALYIIFGYAVFRFCSWAWEEISWKLLQRRGRRNEERELWEKQKADLIAYAERAAGEN